MRFMVLVPPVEPLLARAVSRLPGTRALPGGTVFEPKYDGYRLPVFATAGEVFLRSRTGKDLTSAFPEIADAALALGEDVVLDGEAVIHRGGRLDFTALQQRTSAGGRRVEQLARDQPAHLIAFDLLHHAGADLITWPYRQRRAALESLFQGHGLLAPWALTPTTADPGQAQTWLRQWARVGVEGVVAKGREQPYQPGRRGWQKYRSHDTAEAVIGAVTGTLDRPETVLLAHRCIPDGELRLVARSAPLSTALRDELRKRLAPASKSATATATADHPWRGMRFSSHWGSSHPLDFTCVPPDLVAELQGDNAIDRGRWRHPVRLMRLRTDVTPDEVPAAEPARAPSTPPRGLGRARRTKREIMASTPKRTVYHITPGHEPARKWQVEHREGRRAIREPHRTQ
ncbi:ATP-dependent DNA ligase [Streptomyces sp. NPDC091268]|uniref:ATP-dependent DNA ligase n=1 Tax=Streptomyces sp. NPDC091268 TaxID=3365979 RepID=UPI003816464E